jgi:replicative DNA helicase
MAKDKGAMTGLSTGLKDIDQILWGMKGSEMIVLAGRPSCGKTSLAMNIAEAVALPLHGRKAQGNCLVFSMEMSAIELGKRLASSRARVNQKMIRAGMLSATDLSSLEKAEKEFMESKLYIDEASSPTVMQIRAKARRLHAKKPLSLIVVDYIQLIAPANPRSPREQQVAEASKGLKSLAKELNISVMVLAQLNRDSEKSDRKPRLSDLRESGAIEQDADVVMMLYRPKIEGDEFQTASNLMGLIINKNRNGEVGDVELAFSNTITRFDNYIANS